MRKPFSNEEESAKIIYESHNFKKQTSFFIGKEKKGSNINTLLQKQPFGSVLKKRCPENMQQIYKHPC